MRISDWSSDVCSSDLSHQRFRRQAADQGAAFPCWEEVAGIDDETGGRDHGRPADFGRYELRIGRMGRYRRPAIVPPFGNLRPAVVFAFPAEIELVAAARPHFLRPERSEEHTSELQSLMRIS